MKVAVIGGGAAGFFAALSVAEHHPTAQVVIFEKTDKLLAKVKISGGGRCNVTHACDSASQLANHYPRGGKWLKSAFRRFQVHDCINWFAQRGVALKTESDGRMFPTTDSSQTIVDCLMQATKQAGIVIQRKTVIDQLLPDLVVNGLHFDRVIVATGGHPKPAGFDWLQPLGHRIISPVPSLFTFNMPGNDITQLMGVVIPQATARIQGTQWVQSGPILITHWGLSGPAILKLSAWAARELAQCQYHFHVHINWLDGRHEGLIQKEIEAALPEIHKRKISNACPFPGLPKAFWRHLLVRSGIPLDRLWHELGKKQRNKLLQLLTNDVHKVRGKTTFKEEFVTCGGVDCTEVNFDTMQSQKAPGVHFAGEVLDIDGVTGGFNFQAAWTTGYIAGQLQD